MAPGNQPWRPDPDQLWVVNHFEQLGRVRQGSPGPTSKIPFDFASAEREIAKRREWIDREFLRESLRGEGLDEAARRERREDDEWAILTANTCT